MRKVLLSFALLLSLTSCSLTEPIPIKGEVVSCTSIKVHKSASQPLDCLDGSTGLAVDSIAGPALINVWGSWCQPCKQELPHFGHFLAKYGDKVQVIGVDVEEKSPQIARKFVETHGISWPILYDKSGLTRSTFGMGVPVTWFINQSGKVVHKKYGPFNSPEQIELEVIKYLGVK
jgi:thiol-disulfide isomerase/thioredoxin